MPIMSHPAASPTPSDSIPLFANQLLRLAIEAWTSQLADGPYNDPPPTGRIAHIIRSHVASLGLDTVPPHDLAEHDDTAHLRWLLVRAELQSNRASWLNPAQGTTSSPSVASPAPLGSTAPTDSFSPHESGWSCLVASVHRAISLLSQRTSFASAVESSASRQAYNLAYGLTHEINNPLGNIVARAQRLISCVESEADQKSLATVVDQAMRAHEMLAEVMRAVQPQPMQLAPANVVDTVQSAFAMLQPEADRLHVRWEFDRPDQPIHANIHAEALTEVLRLLARNALEVSRPNDAILWAVSTSPLPPTHASSTAELRLASPTAHQTQLDSQIVRIAIRDTGPGLSPRAARSAFDLFYSGREHGRGLGISLAVVRRIIDSHGGQVRMRSEANAGCSVEIDLPQIEPPPRPRPQLQLNW
jgi:signal transduction histidine kinase